MTSGICPKCGNITNFDNLPLFTKLKCKNCGTELIVPKIFGEFQLTEIIEEHSFFKKYKGSNIQTDKTLTVTILNKKFNGFRDCINICRKEAKDLHHILQHPGIIPLLEYGEIENTFYITEPFFKSFKLSEYNPQVLGEFEAESVFNAFKSIGTILRDSHNKGFTHHNVCPENILIDSEGNVKLQNFFISRVEYIYYSTNKSNYNSSKYYISPEKAEKHQEELKGDIFSLGVMLYYILTGKYPYDGESTNTIIYSRIKRTGSGINVSSQIDYKQPESIDRIRKDIAPEYAELINSMIMPYPVQRPTATNFVTKLNLIEATLEKQKKMKIYSNISPSRNSATTSNPDLKVALKNNELTLHYQPIMNIKKNCIVGLEAFLRWITPVGTVLPAAFLPEAEKNELIHEVGEWALEAACSQLSEWHKMGHKIYITVNISPTQLKKEGFEQNFSNIINKNALDYNFLEFEISQPTSSKVENVSPEKYTEFAKFFNSRVSIAELGSNYASIKKQLSNMRLHSLKIDSEYFADIKKAEKQIENFNSIIAFANFLSVPTVAEKVEAKKQLQFLSKIGCTLAQGYYFYHPAPANEITELLKKQKNK